MKYTRTLTCALLVAAAALGTLRVGAEETQHSAIKPVPRGDAWWKERAKLLNERVKSTPDTQVIFIGDSITQGWEGEGKEVWARYYAPRQAVNLGIGGDRTQHVLWRLLHGNLEGIQPKAAVVMIGTNNSNGEDNTPEQIADGVRAIVRTLREQLPNTKVLLLAIFPRGENFNAQRGKLTQINQVLQKLDDGSQVKFLDLGHRFLTDRGLLPAEIMPDYLHLSAQGYALWAEAIETSLAEFLGESAAAKDVFSGDWILKIRGPDGNELESQLVLKAEGKVLTGKLARGNDRWLEIEQGKIDGKNLAFIVRRERSQGGTMVYHIKATLVEGQLQGTAETEIDGSKVTAEWSARRP